MKRKTFDNYDYEEAFPVELDRDIQKKARKNFEKEHPLQVPDYEEQWKEQQEKLKEWELERLLKEGKVESLYRTTTTKAKNLQSGSELLEAQIYPSFCNKADVPHTPWELLGETYCCRRLFYEYRKEFCYLIAVHMEIIEPEGSSRQQAPGK